MYVQSDTLLFTNVFENFGNMSLKIYELDPTKFLSPPGLECEAALKRTKEELDLLTDINISLIVEKSIRRKIYHFI